MAYDYSEDRAAANEAIAEYGEAGYLRRTAAGSGTDPWNPGAGTPGDYPVMFVIVDYSERDRDGTLIQQNDQQAIIAVGDLPIEATDKDQLLDSQKLKVGNIVSLRPLEPGGTVLLYQAQIRR